MWTRLLRAAAAAGAIAALCASMPLHAAQSDLEKQIQKEEQQLKKITNQIAEGKKKIKDATQKEKKVMNEISGLADKLAEAEQRLNVTVLKRNQVQSKLSDTQKQIEETTIRIDAVKKMLSERMVAVYKYGGSAEFNVFMSATGAQDALATSYLLARMAEQDRMLISDLSTQKETLDSAVAELVKQKSELESRNKELENQRKSIQKTTEERNKLLNQARKDKALYQAEQDELIRASNEMKGKVNQLLAQKKKGQEQNKSAATPVYHKGGKLAWPLSKRGRINSKYGTRVHPVFKTKSTHTGLDLDGKKGDPVLAAAAGEVLFTGWLRGYGQVVIIDHGGDLTTVYAHLSGVDTSENAKVKAGDKVGRVGSTGVATGDHLHFEVRVNGNTTDPMKYLQ